MQTDSGSTPSSSAASDADTARRTYHNSNSCVRRPMNSFLRKSTTMNSISCTIFFHHKQLHHKIIIWGIEPTIDNYLNALVISRTQTLSPGYYLLTFKHYIIFHNNIVVHVSITAVWQLWNKRKWWWWWWWWCLWMDSGRSATSRVPSVDLAS